MVSMRVLALTLALSMVALAPTAFAQSAAECSADPSVDTRLQAVLAKTDRPDDQRAKDESRMSETRFVLGYIKPGDHVLDLGAGGGYASMLLSAAVCDGSVDSQNPPAWIDPKDDAARQALATARPNLHLLAVDFDKVPVPATPYDAIFIGTIYHDTYNEPGHDTAALLKDLASTLKPGGLVILTDHKTVAGAGTSATNTLHRIDEATVLADFKAAGFELVEDSDALANPADDHTLKVFDPTIRGKTDRMALVFRKPM